jgi:hypothetical protein
VQYAIPVARWRSRTHGLWVLFRSAPRAAPDPGEPGVELVSVTADAALGPPKELYELRDREGEPAFARAYTEHLRRVWRDHPGLFADLLAKADRTRVVLTDAWPWDTPHAPRFVVYRALLAVRRWEAERRRRERVERARRQRERLERERLERGA